jgi:hypothetical protein
MKLFKYTEQDLRIAVGKSTSLRQVLLALGVSPYGGNYTVLKKAIRHFILDTSHFSGQAWNRGSKQPPKRALEQYLCNEAAISSYKLRNRLLKERILRPVCSNCRNTAWLGHPIPLELDHISGNNKDNRLENLRLLCPNCHALTSNNRGKNKRKA